MNKYVKISFFILFLLILSIVPLFIVIGEDNFLNDIKEDDENRAIIEWAIKNDLIDVFEDGKFNGDREVKESQFMTSLYIYLGFSNEDKNTKNGFIETELDDVYGKLRTIGVVSKGTNNKEVRKDYISLKEVLDILSVLDEEIYNKENKIELFLGNIIEKHSDFESNIEEGLTRTDLVILFSFLEERKLNFRNEIILDPNLELYETHYFGDWNKRMFYYYPDYSIVIGVHELKEELNKEKDYYKLIKSTELSNIDSEKENYFITVSNIGDKLIDFYGYAIILTDESGPRTVIDNNNFIGLKGDLKLINLVSGNGIKSIHLVLGGNLIEVNLNDLEEFPGNRFFSDKGSVLEWNVFYKGETVKDNIDQVYNKLTDK